MIRYDELIDQLTSRLRIDPELRMDVANELRAHLEDSAAEFLEAGYDQDQAAEIAIKALGDQQELADMLWQANRRRIRIRQVIKWAARATLIPAAIVVTLALGLHVFATVMLVNSLSDWGGGWMQGPSLKGLSPEQRFLFEGDPNIKPKSDAMQSVLERLMGYPAWIDASVEREKSIADRWPDNPIYFGNYAAIRIGMGRPDVDEAIEKSDMDVIYEVIELLDRGEQIEPDNAFYNFIKAAILIKTSSKTSDNPDRTYKAIDRSGKTKTQKCYEIEITDRAVFEQGLTQFRRGLGKPYYTSHTVDMCKLRLDTLPPASELNEYLRRVSLAIITLLPDMSYLRNLSKAICAYSLQLAQQQQSDQAAELIRGVEILAVKQGKSTWTLIELLVARGIRQTAQGHLWNMFNQLGMRDQARIVRADLDQESEFYQSLLTGREQFKKQIIRQGGVLGSILIPAISGYKRAFEPLRRAEYAVAERAALAGLLAVLVLLALVVGGITVRDMCLCRRRDDGPKLLFVGWGRLGRICLLAIIAPLGVYVLYSRFSPVPGWEYGVNIAFARMLLEWVLVGSVVLVLLLSLSYVAIHKRAQATGMGVPSTLKLRDRRWLLGAGMLLALIVVIHGIVWQVEASRSEFLSKFIMQDSCVYLVIAIITCAVIWVVWELFGIFRFGGELLHFRRTLFRSLVPILAAAVILVGVLCGWSLGRVEASAVARAPIFFTDDVEQSDFKYLRDRFARQHQGLLGQLQSQAASGPAEAAD